MKYNKYKINPQWTTSFRIGKLLPIHLQEVVPGDIISGSSVGIFRLSPLNVPTYLTLNLRAHYFFVPYSQLLPEFGEIMSGKDTTTPLPYAPYSLAQATQLQDFGVPLHTADTPDMNLFPLMAYQHVWNEFFANDEHDTKTDLTTKTLLNLAQIKQVRFPTSNYYGAIDTELQQGAEETIPVVAGTPDYINVTEIREKQALQRQKERRAMYGDDYEDLLRQDFGINIPASRVNRPFHIAQGKGTMGISEVVATATSTGENTGELKGHGISGLRVNFKKRKFKEHGIIIGVAFARPRFVNKYADAPIWTNTTKDDLYQPHLANNQQETIYSREVFATSASVPFGYLPKYENLRTSTDTVAGGMQFSSYEEWTPSVELSSIPTVSELQKVQEYETMFQDQTATRKDVQCMFQHNLTKLSQVKKRPKR